jgi:hypothetical protein
MRQVDNRMEVCENCVPLKKEGLDDPNRNRKSKWQKFKRDSQSERKKTQSESRKGKTTGQLQRHNENVPHQHHMVTAKKVFTSVSLPMSRQGKEHSKLFE